MRYDGSPIGWSGCDFPFLNYFGGSHGLSHVLNMNMVADVGGRAIGAGGPGLLAVQCAQMPVLVPPGRQFLLPVLGD